MEFETERAEADIFESFLDDFERSHLFGDEKDRFSFGERIGDQRRDRLGFACSRGTVEDEAFAFAGGIDRI